jgi:hypothetical protein
LQPIELDKVQQELEKFFYQDVYLHLETTNGAYATHLNGMAYSAGAFIRNNQVQVTQGKITGNGPYRIGLKIPQGWIYAEGLTDWEVDEKNRLLLAGHDPSSKLAVALELSFEPF